MADKALLAQLRKSREISVDLGDGLAVTYLRPQPEKLVDMGIVTLNQIGPPTVRVSIDHVQKLVNGWSGFSAATFLGAAVGSSDPLDFDADIWAEVSPDHPEWTGKIALSILEAIVEHNKKNEGAAKNSEPG